MMKSATSARAWREESTNFHSMNSDSPHNKAASVVEQAAKCDKCGATLLLESGACVHCLLRKGLQGEGDMSATHYERLLAEVDTPYQSWWLGNYEILEQIGCGGMGVIYRARQRHSQRIVAVKRVLSYRADSPGALERFRREAQAIASLDHPNILPIYEVSQSEDGLPFFSMKFAEQGSLEDNLALFRHDPRKCAQLMARVGRAVEYAHSRGVLHRDIKPGNILLNDRGEPLVSDFGLAKLLDGHHDLTRSLTTFGTAGYIAPEQAEGAASDVTPAADVYSLGAVLFKLLAGRAPFLGPNPVSIIRQASEAPAPRLRSLAPSLDRDLEIICARCLERDPDARYQSAGDFAEDLERWLDGRPIIARPISPAARVYRWVQRNPRLVATGVAGLVSGATAVSLLQSALFQAPRLNQAHSRTAALPVRWINETKSQPSHPPIDEPSHRQADKNLHKFYQDLFTNLLSPIEPGRIGVNAPSKEPFLRMPAGFNEARLVNSDAPNAKMQLSSATPRPAIVAGTRKEASESRPQANKITVTASAPSANTGPDNSARHRAPQTAPGTDKAADGPASLQGFVKDSKGEPIQGADVRIEARDGRRFFTTVRTDSKGRYFSRGLPPGVYRVTLLVNGEVKASVMNTQTNANRPTDLNFDFKRISQSGSSSRGRRHMVWVPSRTGSHIGGSWVEVDDGGAVHSGSNVQTVTARNW